MIDKGYKEIQMSIIAGYNDSDWTEGWSAMLGTGLVEILEQKFFHKSRSKTDFRCS